MHKLVSGEERMESVGVRVGLCLDAGLCVPKLGPPAQAPEGVVDPFTPSEMHSHFFEYRVCLNNLVVFVASVLALCGFFFLFWCKLSTSLG